MNKNNKEEVYIQLISIANELAANQDELSIDAENTILEILNKLELDEISKQSILCIIDTEMFWGYKLTDASKSIIYSTMVH